jgi:long-chain fatty acid transport protein
VPIQRTRRATADRRGALFADNGVRADIDLPDSLPLGSHQFHPRWALSADVLWMRWSQFKELRIRFNRPSRTRSAAVANSWRLRLD